MGKQLRNGLELLRQFYIKELLESSSSDSSDHELRSLTFNELESLYKKIFSPQDRNNLLHRKTSSGKQAK